MTVRRASAAAAKSRRCNAWRPLSYIATASWYVGLRGGGGGGGAGGAGGWMGLTSFGAVAPAVFSDRWAVDRDALLRAGRAAACCLAPRAGFRGEVRVFLVTRRDLAIGITVRTGVPDTPIPWDSSKTPRSRSRSDGE